MRAMIPFVLMLAACSQGPALPSLPTGTFAGEGRDRMCIGGSPGVYRAGVIVYGRGDTNCSVSGRIETKGSTTELIPRGEGTCRIPLLVEDNSVRIGQPPGACAYYCGPGASLAGKTFTNSETTTAVADLAGDPLC